MDIIVKQQDTASSGVYLFDVQINEHNSSTRHTVTMDKEYYVDLSTQTEPDEIIKQTFLFLLEREPKEMILSEFDITVVSHYFPEFENYLKETFTNT